MCQYFGDFFSSVAVWRKLENPGSFYNTTDNSGPLSLADSEQTICDRVTSFVSYINALIRQ